MPLTSFTIDGVEVNPRVEGFEIRETHGGVSTLTCQVESVGSPVLQFSIHEDVAVEEDGVKVFAGTVSQTRVKGDGGPNLYDQTGGAPQIIWTITAEDHNRLAERVYVTETVVAGTTLEAFLITLVTYLSGLGVMLHASQVTGPNLPAMQFDRQRASDVLKSLSDATGFTWRIDYDKQLRMWQAGDLLAPFDIDEFDDPVRWTDDVEVERVVGDNYANRVIVISDPITEIGHVETFTEGVDTYPYVLQYTPFATRGYVIHDGLFETLRIPSDPDPASWTLNGNTLTRDAGAPTSGQVTSIEIDGTFQATATAEDAAAIAAFGLFEHIERVSNITTVAAAQVIADAILAERLNAGEDIVAYETRWTAPTLRAGQQQTISATARSVSGAHLITDMRVRAETPVTASYAASGLGLIRNVTAKKNQLLGGKWQHTYRDWLGGGAAAGSVTTTVGSGSVPQVGPGGPDTSVQYNKAGVFGGDAEFTYNATTNSVVCGALSSITAFAPESCQAFGYDTHIADP